MLTEKIFAFAQVADVTVLWILIILSVCSCTVILERFLALRKVARDTETTRQQIKFALVSNNIEELENIAKDTNSFSGKAANRAMKHLNASGSKGLEETFNTFVLTERPDVEKYLNFLATIGSNAPYIGLFGTVLGIMKAFNDLATASDAGQQTVMAGISMALVATAAGLFVAIPAVIAYNSYMKKVENIFTTLDSIKELALAYAKKKGI